MGYAQKGTLTNQCKLFHKMHMCVSQKERSGIEEAEPDQTCCKEIKKTNRKAKSERKNKEVQEKIGRPSSQ
jgi:hypothetical protein